MYGAILGDIAGSRFEFSKPKGFNGKTEKLFAGTARFTDDTVLTVATKYAVLNSVEYHSAYKLFGNRYPKAGYGNMFLHWLHGRSNTGYGSFGNGAAMRVSFIGEYFDTLEEVEREAERSAMCTHNHPEGIKAAKVTAGAIFLARAGGGKKDIMEYAEKHGYNVKKPLLFYRPFSKFDVTAQSTMPLAIRCVLESESWESTIRNVYSVKCDTDTVACIAGGIAEALYGETGYDEESLLERFLVRPVGAEKFDTFLYDWAVKQYKKGGA